MRKTLIATASLALVAALAVASCSAPQGAAARQGPRATATSAARSAAPSPAASATGGTTTTPSGIPAAPSKDPTVVALWEALMSPVGEYAASASYAAVLDKFGAVEPYASIQAAEERHIAALTRRLTALGVAVPPNPYADTAVAPADLTTAATAWADGEVANVAMYDRLLTQVSGDAQATRVFTNLRRASLEMHLPAFRAAAANGGVSP